MPTRTHILGISGASGAAYAQRALRCLLEADAEVHLVVTNFGKRLLHDELGMETFDAAALAGLPPGTDPRDAGLFIHPSKDVGASIASGSFRHDGMIVLPCSSNTLGAIAAGISDELLTRAAQVALKERLPLILCHRESPLSLIDIENMRTLTLAGAIIAPTNPGLYLLPQSIDDIINFVVGRTLDLLKVPHNLPIRWAPSPPPPPAGEVPREARRRG